VEHNLLLQAISTVDENGQPVTKGTKVSRGYYADNGPPTTLSGTGRDVSLSYQGFAALDNVQFVNGNQLGSRLMFQVRWCVWWWCVSGCVAVCGLWRKGQGVLAVCWERATASRRCHTAHRHPRRQHTHTHTHACTHTHTRRPG
jgi:hypothetical protein